MRREELEQTRRSLAIGGSLPRSQIDELIVWCDEMLTERERIETVCVSSARRGPTPGRRSTSYTQFFGVAGSTHRQLWRGGCNLPQVLTRANYR